MTMVTRFGTILAAGAMFAMLGVGPALADPSISQAKKDGVVGERVDGYLGFVDGGEASADLRRLVAEINAKRRDVYTRLSEQTGESLSNIAAVAAEKQLTKAEPGEYVMDQDGRWIRK